MLSTADAKTLRRLFPEVLIALTAARIYLSARRELLAAEEQHLMTGQGRRRYEKAMGAESAAANMLAISLKSAELPETL